MSQSWRLDTLHRLAYDSAPEVGEILYIIICFHLSFPLFRFTPFYLLRLALVYIILLLVGTSTFLGSICSTLRCLRIWTGNASVFQGMALMTGLSCLMCIVIVLPLPGLLLDEPRIYTSILFPDYCTSSRTLFDGGRFLRSPATLT